ncbi:MAG: hypothetical protein JW776_14900 [Candidatus Lokiarchaeota archaeon]|nr:hypothetical protein [Candidatus Lokiarchaeota archaeon]
MKIWLNCSLACPEDASYPFELIIFKWENKEEKFRQLLDGYKKDLLLNLRNEESPLDIHFDVPNSEFKKEEDNLIILSELKRGKVVFYDTNVIHLSTLSEYLEWYLKFLAELSDLSDKTTYKSAKDCLDLTRTVIYEKIRTYYDKISSIDTKKEDGYELIQPIFQDLLFLNYYFTYMEIDEGLLICPKCKRWYPIIKTIPRIYPKSMKREPMDTDFQKKWREFYPDDVIMD